MVKKQLKPTLWLFCFFQLLIDKGYFEVCHAMFPLAIEANQDADERILFHNFVLYIYRKMCSVVTCIAGSCSVDRFITWKVSISLIGSSSHKFFLAVEEQ